MLIKPDGTITKRLFYQNSSHLNYQETNVPHSCKQKHQILKWGITIYVIKQRGILYKVVYNSPNTSSVVIETLETIIAHA